MSAKRPVSTHETHFMDTSSYGFGNSLGFRAENFEEAELGNKLAPPKPEGATWRNTPFTNFRRKHLGCWQNLLENWSL